MSKKREPSGSLREDATVAFGAFLLIGFLVLGGWIGSLVTLGVYTLNAALYLFGAATGSSWPYFVSLPGTVYGTAALAILLVELRLPYSPGANDNAAAVAVNLGIASALACEPLSSTEVWLAFTGAEEVDHRGLKELLKEL